MACDASPCLATLMLALCSSRVCPRLHGNYLTDVNLSGCACLVDGAAATHAALIPLTMMAPS